MVTPTREEILDYARTLYHKDNPEAPTPEDDELKEDGYTEIARHELMRSESAEALADLERHAAELNRRIVTESEHGDIIEVKRLKEELKELKKKAPEQIIKVVEHREVARKVKGARKIKPKMLHPLPKCKRSMKLDRKRKKCVCRWGSFRGKCRPFKRPSYKREKGEDIFPEMPTFPAA